MTPTHTSHYASPGGVNQHGGSLKVSTCKRCGNEICWATSARTGKNYPVNVRTGHMDQRFYQGNDLHKCDEVLATRQANTDAEAHRSNLLATISEAQRRYRAGEISTDEYLAAIETIND